MCRYVCSPLGRRIWTCNTQRVSECWYLILFVSYHLQPHRHKAQRMIKSRGHVTIVPHKSLQQHCLWAQTSTIEELWWLNIGCPCHLDLLVTFEPTPTLNFACWDLLTAFGLTLGRIQITLKIKAWHHWYIHLSLSVITIFNYSPWKIQTTGIKQNSSML